MSEFLYNAEKKWYSCKKKLDIKERENHKDQMDESFCTAGFFFCQGVRHFVFHSHSESPLQKLIIMYENDSNGTES